MTARPYTVAQKEAALHKLLIARQSKTELMRKQQKAQRRAIWTQEDIDAAERCGLYISLRLKWE